VTLWRTARGGSSDTSRPVQCVIVNVSIVMVKAVEMAWCCCRENARHYQPPQLVAVSSDRSRCTRLSVRLKNSQCMWRSYLQRLETRRERHIDWLTLTDAAAGRIRCDPRRHISRPAAGPAPAPHLRCVYSTETGLQSPQCDRQWASEMARCWPTGHCNFYWTDCAGIACCR